MLRTVYADPGQVRAIEGRFADLCLRVFGADRVEAVVAHGSAVKGGLIPGFSDFDFMVLLTPDHFGPFGLAVDKAFAVQAGIDGLGVREAGLSYAQASFRDARRLPDGWTGPVPGAYHLVHGALPNGLEADDARLHWSSLHTLRQLPALVAADLTAVADALDSDLRRRLRLLATRVTPVLFAAVSHDQDGAAEVWAMDKVAALRLFEERYRDDPQVSLPRRFYEALFAIGPDEAPPEACRAALRTGFQFLMWAARLPAAGAR